MFLAKVWCIIFMPPIMYVAFGFFHQKMRKREPTTSDRFVAWPDVAGDGMYIKIGEVNEAQSSSK